MFLNPALAHSLIPNVMMSNTVLLFKWFLYFQEEHLFRVTFNFEAAFQQLHQQVNS